MNDRSNGKSRLEALDLEDRGFGWNIEMQVRAVEHDLGVVEIPVLYHPREAGRPKISGTWRGTVRAGWGMLRMLAHLWREKGSVTVLNGKERSRPIKDTQSKRHVSQSAH